MSTLHLRGRQTLSPKGQMVNVSAFASRTVDTEISGRAALPASVLYGNTQLIWAWRFSLLTPASSHSSFPSFLCIHPPPQSPSLVLKMLQGSGHRPSPGVGVGG